MALEFFGSYHAWLAMAIGTHALVGYVLGAATFSRPTVGALGAVLADVDLLFPGPDGAPLGHRGMTHSALALGIAVAIASYWGRDVAGSVGIGYVSQLAIDATTPKGIPIVFPLSTENVGVAWNLHSKDATILLLGLCAVALILERHLLRSRTDG
ncbi:hypothetical protein L593_12345 [Salinarchaeum sp. Harcht-Bsk1]|uniref:metal-dependent hydrolase n=1 Tax=Salinarchaeum sp. Harcht-Bsk1 TaxID=1333523 RepID=UPI0003423BC3|nr:metal-dependent hydrolase [Salinarchaeum sp. Harcht-Bsk1]AGN02408.1 hypothetical protein L593_12345 [Salinarchaeum sp. Harcht-Bsk1]